MTIENIVLQNENFIAEIKIKGAELCRLYSKKLNKEIIWSGDPTYWGRHAPVLFPIVGKVKNNQYKVNGETYELGQHGFARDFNFEVINRTKNSCSLQLSATKETLKKYPFQFSFITKFNLNDNGITTSYNVENIDQRTILFSLGAHPAFNCPFSEKSSLNDYKISLPFIEKSQLILLADNGLIGNKRIPFFNKNKSFKLSEQLFENDALIFDDLKSESLIIESHEESMKLVIAWENFPHLGIWKPANAPFICIEPWQGMADNENHNGNLEDKFGIIKLKEKDTHSASYSIEIN